MKKHLSKHLILYVALLNFGMGVFLQATCGHTSGFVFFANIFWLYIIHCVMKVYNDQLRYARQWVEALRDDNNDLTSKLDTLNQRVIDLEQQNHQLKQKAK